MCLSIPGKIIEIKENSFIIDYGAEKREALNTAIPVKVGDYVFVSQKVIISKIPKEKALEFLEMIS